MTADEYFDKIKAVQKRRVSLERAIKEEKNRIYDISGIDPSKEKVSGGRSLDIGDKLIRQDELLTAFYKELSCVQSILGNCMERINGLLDENGKKDFNTIDVLQNFFFSGRPSGRIAENLGVSREYAYRKRRKAIDRFGEFYRKELDSMEDIC
jgi:hypothetical protein|nr:MAG TPA: Protein of unknown function (DUF1492) [Caudoviricetes sp.]